MNSIQAVEGMSVNEFWRMAMRADSRINHNDGMQTLCWRRIDGSERKLTFNFNPRREQWMLVPTR